MREVRGRKEDDFAPSMCLVTQSRMEKGWTMAPKVRTVLWGSAGLSSEDLDVLFGRWVATFEISRGSLFNALSWGSGVWIRAIFAKGDAEYSSGLRERFRFVFANVLGAGPCTNFFSLEE